MERLALGLSTLCLSIYLYVRHSAPMAEYELFYFDIRGRGQPIRYLLLDQGIKFKDVSVDPWEKWQNVYKPVAPFRLCPFLKDGNFEMAESNAILRYLARKHGLYPQDIQEAAIADMINDNLEDIRKKYSDVIYSENFEAEKEKFAKDLPGLLTDLETQINARKHGFVLPKVSFVDYNMFDLLDILQLHSPGCLDKLVALKTFHGGMAERPNIKRYRESEEFKRLKVNYNEYV